MPVVLQRPQQEQRIKGSQLCLQPRPEFALHIPRRVRRLNTLNTEHSLNIKLAQPARARRMHTCRMMAVNRRVASA